MMQKTTTCIVSLNREELSEILAQKFALEGLHVDAGDLLLSVRHSLELDSSGAFWVEASYVQYEPPFAKRSKD